MKIPRVCVVIPIKERSTRIPGKNLKNLAGKPMMAYIIETAGSARGVDRVIVSTESKKVKRVAEKYGAEVPFLRPRSLITDKTTSQQVLIHATAELAKKGYKPDYILLLYATSPLLSRRRIEEAIRIAASRNSDSVISGSIDKGHYWKKRDAKWERLYPVKLVNSQFQKPLFKENGAIYMTKTAILKKQLVGRRADVLLMDSDESIDVDWPEDWKKVEEILRKRKRS